MKGPHQLSSDWAYRRVLYYCALRGLACSPAPPIAPTTPTTSPSKHHAPSGVNRSYLKAQLQEKEVRGYKAAGVLPIAYFPSPPPDRLAGPNHQEQEDHQELVPYVLLGTERRDSGEGPILNILGTPVPPSPCHSLLNLPWGGRQAERGRSAMARQLQPPGGSSGRNRAACWGCVVPMLLLVV